MKPLDWHRKRAATKMPPTAELLLNVIYNHKAPMPVMQAMDVARHHNVASTTTIHGGIKWLKAHAYIKVQEDTGDGRSKLCTLTPKGTKYLEAVA